MSKKLLERPTVESGNGHHLRQELILQGGEHIPFLQVIVLNALESVRQAIINANDGGLSALLGLWAVLPSGIRSQFEDLPGKIEYYSRVSFVVHRSYSQSRMTLRANPVPRLEYDASEGKIVEKFGSDKTISVRQLKSQKLALVDVTPKSVRRQVVITSFIQILDVLDEAGLLAKSRTELIGGEL
jgi:hypothetical protein